jgi:hypothetical protein
VLSTDEDDAAPLELGIPYFKPNTQVITGTKLVTPAVNPQVTGEDGKFGWMVDNGCWYVHADAPFYRGRTTSVVGAPPNLANANLALKTYPVYIPLIVQTVNVDETGNDFIGEIYLAPDKQTFAAGESVEITVVISNVGQVDPSTLDKITSDPIWVDLYINPKEPPTGPNRGWVEACGIEPCYGMTWYIEHPPKPGQDLVLKSTATSYDPDFSNWGGSFASGTTDLYLYVDSWKRSPDGREINADGAVGETNENNNRAEKHIRVE